MELLEDVELITLIVNTAMGSAAYIGFQVNVKKQKLTLGYVIFTFFISLFIANLVANALDAWGKESWKSVGMLLGAFSATYLMEWFDQDSAGIFRRILKLFLGKDKDDDYNS